MAKVKSYEMHIVSHTHWDREWRLKKVRITNLLERLTQPLALRNRHRVALTVPPKRIMTLELLF